MIQKNYTSSLSSISTLVKDSIYYSNDYLSLLGGFDALKISFSFDEIKDAHSKYRAFLLQLMKTIER